MTRGSETDDDDRVLLIAWRQGDNLAGNRLLERHFGTVVRFLRAAYRLQRAELSELVQRTMLACVESKARIPDEVPFRVYLLGIARRLVADTLREGYRAEARARIVGPELSIASPSQIAAAREQERLLLRALQRLTSELQVVVLLFYWEQLTCGEIATICDLATGTVKSRLRRAKEQLLLEMRALTPDEALYRSTAHGLQRWALSLRAHLETYEAHAAEPKVP
ncbi:MAG: sigma-70 family RNA polymerase sigma factor [Nannocystaceae bacterium]|nr:sigma-70 family RNA polymerase sigma factor [Nannocystaceae bacterium]